MSKTGKRETSSIKKIKLLRENENLSKTINLGENITCLN